MPITGTEGVKVVPTEERESSTLDRKTFLRRSGVAAAALGGFSGVAAVAAQEGIAARLGVGATRGGKLTVGVGQVYQDVNPLTAAGYRWMRCVALGIYEPLLKYDDKGSPVPMLAESFRVASNGTVIFKLRKNVMFHNGKPMRARDVVWSLNRWHDTTKAVPPSIQALPPDIWRKAEALDDFTVRVTTKKPTRLAEYFRSWFILPENADDLQLGSRPIGTGPFQFKQFIAGDRLELVRNSEYWVPGLPYLNELTFKFLPDAAAQIANTLSGDVNFLFDVPVTVADQALRKSGLTTIPGGLYYAVVAPADVPRAASKHSRTAGASVGGRSRRFESDCMGRQGNADDESVRGHPLRQRHTIEGCEVRPGASEIRACESRRAVVDAELDDAVGSAQAIGHGSRRYCSRGSRRLGSRLRLSPSRSLCGSISCTQSGISQVSP